MAADRPEAPAAWLADFNAGYAAGRDGEPWKPGQSRDWTRGYDAGEADRVEAGGLK